MPEFVVITDKSGNAVELRLFGEANDYDGLVRAIRSGVDFRQLSRETLDSISGLHGGYSAKLLTIPPMRGIGPASAGPLLQSAALKILVVEDPDALKVVENRYVKRRKK